MGFKRSGIFWSGLTQAFGEHGKSSTKEVVLLDFREVSPAHVDKDILASSFFVAQVGKYWATLNHLDT